MAKISPSILSLEFFCKNSIYLRVRLRERFVNPQLLIQLAVYKIKEPLTAVLCTPEGYLKSDEEGTSPLTAPYGEKEKGVVPLEATEKGLQF